MVPILWLQYVPNFCGIRAYFEKSELEFSRFYWTKISCAGLNIVKHAFWVHFRWFHTLGWYSDIHFTKTSLVQFIWIFMKFLTVNYSYFLQFWYVVNIVDIYSLLPPSTLNNTCVKCPEIAVVLKWGWFGVSFLISFLSTLTLMSYTKNAYQIFAKIFDKLILNLKLDKISFINFWTNLL